MNTEQFEADEFRVTSAESFNTNQLSEEAQVVFDELGVPSRGGGEILVGEDAKSGEKSRIKFATMNLYPDDKDANPEAPRACYQNEIVGVGWGKAGEDGDHDELSASDYTRNVFDEYWDENSTTENDFAYFSLWLSPGDIIITKNLGPVVKYARVKGPIQHRSQADNEDELEEHGIGFFREVEWVDVSPGEAPSKVLSTTCRGTLTLPNLDRASMEQIVDQFDSPIGNVDAEVKHSNVSKLFSDLSDESVSNKANANRLINSLSASGSYNGLETVVCTYIQHETGAVMHPSSRSFPGVEALFRNLGENGPETYGVQVKRGSFENKAKLRQFADNHDTLFLFSSSGDAIEHEEIVNIDHSDLSTYIIENPQDLPPVEIDRLLRVHQYRR